MIWVGYWANPVSMMYLCTLLSEWPQLSFLAKLIMMIYCSIVQDNTFLYELVSPIVLAFTLGFLKAQSDNSNAISSSFNNLLYIYNF